MILQFLFSGIIIRTMKKKLSTLQNFNKYNHPDHPPRYSPLVRSGRSTYFIRQYTYVG